MGVYGEDWSKTITIEEGNSVETARLRWKQLKLHSGASTIPAQTAFSVDDGLKL